MTARYKTTSYELLQHLEHQFLYDYFRAKSRTEDPENQLGCKAEAEVLVTAILNFRDTINADSQFVQYKVLVGFESVYPGHWSQRDFDRTGSDPYRREEANRYIDEINAENASYWFDLIERCAKTKSNDGATFPAFYRFLSMLAEAKAEVADNILACASEDLCRFLPGFLKGLSLNSRSDIYERALERELDSARNLAGVAQHLRQADVVMPNFTARLLKHAIDLEDAQAVTGCLLFAFVHYGTDEVPNTDTLFRDALNFLNENRDARWVWQAWFLDDTQFYEKLTQERTTQVIQSLGYLRRVDHDSEQILLRLAEQQPDAVWDYFATRLDNDAEDIESEDHFQAVPDCFHGLEGELSKDPLLAISKGLSWFNADPKLFQYRGGRLISIVFPNCTTKFSEALVELVKTGSDTETDFVLAIFQNYEGEASTFGVLKEIVTRFSGDDSKMNLVSGVIESTGVVSGELGFAEAYRNMKDSLTEWLTDERPEVKAFAGKKITELDLMIASEHRRAETSKEMRRLSFVEE
jgi:hypothetical protein